MTLLSKLNPLVLLLNSILIFSLGLVLAETKAKTFFILVSLLILTAFGFADALATKLPSFLVFTTIVLVVFWWQTKSAEQTYSVFVRFFAAFLAYILMSGLDLSYLTEILIKLKVSRKFVLGICVMFTFLPVFMHEFRHNMQVKRYVGNTKKTLYQKFRGQFVPVLVRAFEITEMLTLAATLKNFNLNKSRQLVLPTYFKSLVKNISFILISFASFTGVALYAFVF